MITRRDFFTAAGAGLMAPLPYSRGASPDTEAWRDRVIHYLETLARPDGAYGWGPDVDSHITPAYFVIGAYKLLDREAPRKGQLAEWVRTHNPLPERRLKDRPLRRFHFEQIQALLWLGADAGSFRELIAGWTGPIEFTERYEFGGNPIFQQEVAALRCRELLGLGPTPGWREYVLSRRRPDGTFNTTPGNDGSAGHLMNTLWGLQALNAIGEKPGEVADWVRRCQLPDGGFTYAPKPEIAGIDEIAYTWAALNILKLLNARAANPETCAAYVASLWNEDGGFGDRPGRESNPAATFYALDSLRILAAAPKTARPLPKRRTLPSGLKVFTMQVEAPGKGSPAEAVELARCLRIDWWAAKNTDKDWIGRAQQIADLRKVPVRFCPGNEEYGTYVSLPGLGTYSHLADLVAPPGVDFGAPMANQKKPNTWQQFRDQRIAALQRARGRMIWQFNENEELTRILLDEAVERGTYAAISTYHFGNDNFQHSQPFLMRYQNVLPFIALQDSHAAQSWWWGDQLEGFRTVYLARTSSWEDWLEALKTNRVMAICRDSRTNFQTRYAGGDVAVCRVVAEWWEANYARLTRPGAVITVIHPGDAFEEPKAASGVLIRVRVRRNNTQQAAPLEALTELVRLEIDGRETPAKLVEAKGQNGRMTDSFHLAELAGISKGRHAATAVVREITGKKESKVQSEFTV